MVHGLSTIERWHWKRFNWTIDVDLEAAKVEALSLSRLVFPQTASLLVSDERLQQQQQQKQQVATQVAARRKLNSLLFILHSEMAC